MDWETLRRTTAFRLVFGFIVFLVIARFQNTRWTVALPLSLLAALALTALFNFLDNKKK